MMLLSNRLNDLLFEPQSNEVELGKEIIGRFEHYESDDSEFSPGMRNALGYALLIQDRSPQAFRLWSDWDTLAQHPLMTRARYERQNQNLPEAIDLYLLLLTAEPEHKQAWFWLATSRLELGQVEGALEAYQRAWKLGLADSVFPILELLVSQSRFDEVLELSLDALNSNPSHPDRLRWWQMALLGTRATEQFELGQQISAEALLEYGEEPTLYAELALLIFNDGSGELEEALSILDRALSLDDQFARAYYLKGILLARDGQYERASLNYSKAVGLNLNNKEWRLAWINSLVAAKENNEALTQLEQAIIDFPAFDSLYYRLAQVHLDQDNLEEATRAIVQAIELTEIPNAEYFHLAGILEEELGNLRGALRWYERGLNEIPDNDLLLSAAGQICSEDSFEQCYKTLD